MMNVTFNVTKNWTDSAFEASTADYSATVDVFQYAEDVLFQDVELRAQELACLGPALDEAEKRHALTVVQQEAAGQAK